IRVRVNKVALTDMQGTVAERRTFDAFGKLSTNEAVNAQFPFRIDSKPNVIFLFSLEKNSFGLRAM
ncbi:MAG: hypothetical protein HWE24_18450, partial [Oceanospirillaceae bacterium]|nr:hypothetical protein [Oceanospirillaceae bacterium]